MKKFVGIPSEKTAEITEVRSFSSAWPDTAICLRAQLVATRDVLSFCGFLLLSAQASCTWRQLNGDFFCCVVFEQAVDAVMNTFTAEYDAAAAQLSLSAAKEQAGAETSGLQARPVPAAPGPAPTSPTAPPSSLRMSSRPKVALKTVSLGVLHAGWLTKKGAVRKNWKRRWFEMSPDFTLRYFDNQDEPRQEKGMVVLYNREVETGVAMDEYENCIALRPAVLPGRTYYFVADKSHEVDHWLPFMRAACQLSRHSSSPVPALAGAFHAAYLRSAESVGGPISGAVRPSSRLKPFALSHRLHCVAQSSQAWNLPLYAATSRRRRGITCHGGSPCAKNHPGRGTRGPAGLEA